MVRAAVCVPGYLISGPPSMPSLMTQGSPSGAQVELLRKTRLALLGPGNTGLQGQPFLGYLTKMLCLPVRFRRLRALHQSHQRPRPWALQAPTVQLLNLVTWLEPGQKKKTYVKLLVSAVLFPKKPIGLRQRVLRCMQL